MTYPHVATRYIAEHCRPRPALLAVCATAAVTMHMVTALLEADETFTVESSWHQRSVWHIWAAPSAREAILAVAARYPGQTSSS